MTAKEMFEELGYEENPNREDQIRYTMRNEVGIIVEIAFDFYKKYFIKQDDNDLAYYILFDEFKAIQKQIEELGW